MANSFLEGNELFKECKQFSNPTVKDEVDPIPDRPGISA